MITTIKLLNTTITSDSLNFFFFWCWEHLRSTQKISSMQNTVLLPTVTILYIRSSELFYFITESLYPLTNISPFLPLPQPREPPFYSDSMSSTFLDSTYKWDHTVLVFLYLTSLNWHDAHKLHPFCHKWQDFLLSHGWIMSHCVCVSSLSIPPLTNI